MSFKNLLLLLCLASLVFAVPVAGDPVIGRADSEILDIQVTPISPLQAFLYKLDLLAIGFDQSYYAPGATAEVTFISSVPCNTRYVQFSLNKDGLNYHFINVGSKFSPCTTSLVKIPIIVPSDPGAYDARLVFQDGNGAILYVDSAKLTVASSQPSCRTAYCTGWSKVDRVIGGDKESQTCYVVNQNTCAETPFIEYRLKCDPGYHQQGNNLGRCYPDDPANPVCGDGIVQSGEQCDSGGGNGVCPSKCNLFCQNSNCQNLPSPAPPSNGGDSGGADDGSFQWHWVFLLIGVIFAILGILLIVAGAVL